MPAPVLARARRCLLPRRLRPTPTCRARTLTRSRFGLTTKGQPLDRADDLQPTKPPELLPLLIALGDREIGIADGEPDDLMRLEDGMRRLGPGRCRVAPWCCCGVCHRRVRPIQRRWRGYWQPGACCFAPVRATSCPREAAVAARPPPARRPAPAAGTALADLASVICHTALHHEASKQYGRATTIDRRRSDPTRSRSHRSGSGLSTWPEPCALPVPGPTASPTTLAMYAPRKMKIIRCRHVRPATLASAPSTQAAALMVMSMIVAHECEGRQQSSTLQSGCRRRKAASKHLRR